MNWDQLRTILWLRWRLMANQSRRSGGLGAAIAAIVAVGAVILGLASFFIALLVGIFALAQASTTVVWGVWAGVTLAFLIFWTVGLLMELQRSETIDLQRLMYLPVVLGQIFVINYVASHLTVSIVIGMPVMLGLALGLTISHGPRMLLLAPLALSMIFMITAWTYCLRGWLAAMMANPRRRRTITVAIMFAFVMLGQGPNLYFNVIQRSHRQQEASQANRSSAQLEQIRSIQKYVPPFWLPLGAQALMEGSALPALCGTLGCLAIGTWGLRRAYRGTLRFYLGDSGARVAAKMPTVQRTATGGSVKTSRLLVERKIPGVPEQAAALALATFRSLLRAPEVKMAWGTSFIATIIATATFFFNIRTKVPEEAKPFIVTGAAAFSMFMLVQFINNQFGFDRDGFRALVLSPVERRLILLGKNLAWLPVALGFGVTLITLIGVRLEVSPVTMLAAYVQLATLVMLAASMGNVVSVLAPYRIQAGSMKPTKLPGLAMLVMLVCNLLFPIALAPAFIPPLAELLWRKAGLSELMPVNLILSLAFAAIMAVAYWQLLNPLGRLLQERETKILGVVTVEVE